MGQILDPAAAHVMKELDELDDAIATHLRMTVRGRGSMSPSEIRTAIIAWCSSTEARTRFSTEALDGTAYALGVMDEPLLGPLVRDLMSRGDRLRAPSVA